jgi:murein L,D-transpeptidase YcbB/YkuD
MERWRWLPEDLGQRHILVNITDFTLSVVENGQRVMNAKVIVGRTERPTPVLTATMSYLVMSPDWNVPPTIALEDKLPVLQKNAYALAKQNIRVFSTAGREIDPGQVNWRKVNTSNFAYQFRQDPGPRNALGRIKFIFPNAYSVYLHDTPSRGLFNSTARTFSSGCVRISNPIDLAEYLLKGNPRWNRAAIESASQGKKQRTVPLREQIPVHLFYLTAWVDEDNTVNFRNDIYERDRLLVKALYPGAIAKQKA